jgi:acetyltransferase-like isoleucine patch superfamily enzyme
MVGVRIGAGTLIDLSTLVEPQVQIGQNCNIASTTIGTGTYVVDGCVLRHTKIGRFCAIADGVRAGTGTHPTHTFVSIHPAFFSTIGQAGFTFSEKNTFDEMPKVPGSNYAVEIGNDVWIGSGVHILQGIRIGDGAIIGAGAVVTKDVEPYSVNVGVPARNIRYRFSSEQIAFLKELRWWDRDFDWLRANVSHFQDIEQAHRLFGGQVR